MNLFLLAAFMVASTTGLSIQPIGTPNPSFLGTFENHHYEIKNDWHYVIISYNFGEGTYTWKNKAGRSWTLYPTNNGNQLKVGTDCPYYKNGHVVATFDANGVAGPWGEIYSRRYGNSLLIGNFENHLYDNGGKNDWHFVSINYNEITNTYTWRNKAGVTWTLFPSKDSDTLKVGKDCTYYNNGYTTAKFNQMGIYGPWNEFYTKTESKFWFLGTFKRSNTNDQVIITYDASHDNYILTIPGHPVKTCIYLATPDEYKLKALSDCPGIGEYIMFSYKGLTTNEVLYGRVH